MLISIRPPLYHSYYKTHMSREDILIICYSNDEEKNRRNLFSFEERSYDEKSYDHINHIILFKSISTVSVVINDEKSVYSRCTHKNRTDLRR